MVNKASCDNCYIAFYITETRGQKRFTISKLSNEK